MLVVGPTGYIGKFVVKELVKRGYNVVAFAREQAGIKGKLGKEDIVKVGLPCAILCQPPGPCSARAPQRRAWHDAARAVPIAQEFTGAEVRFGSVLDLDSLRKEAFKEPVDVVVSCLASRTGQWGEEETGSSPGLWLPELRTTIVAVHRGRAAQGSRCGGGATRRPLLLMMMCYKPKLVGPYGPEGSRTTAQIL